MAKIVLGLATSHGPMLSTPPEEWGQRVAHDRVTTQHFKGRTWSFDQLVQERKGEKLEQQIRPEVWHDRHAACRKAISTLADAFAKAKPDVAVIFGNDQREIFQEDNTPAIGVFWGDTIVNSEYSKEKMASLPPGIGISIPGHIPPGGATYAGVPDLGKHIIEEAIADGFDVASLTRMAGDRTPHAFGFIYRQIMNDHAVPSVPVILNTFYPPNQPTTERCFELGTSVLKAVESWKSDARVALIASGGLSHFVIDEEVDQTVLTGMRKRDFGKVFDLGEPIFQAGTSEVKNWIPLAGAMGTLGYDYSFVDYVPCYRSEAGTGNAMGFVYWTA